MSAAHSGRRVLRLLLRTLLPDEEAAQAHARLRKPFVQRGEAVIDKERVASVLIDAAAYGDREAGRRWQVSARTIRSYRVRMRTDKELAAFCREQIDAQEAELGALRVRFLRKALAEMERRLTHDDTTLPDIAEAVRVVGELHQVAEALEDESGTGQDPEPEETQGGFQSEAATAH